jgi:hypothetical protein
LTYIFFKEGDLIIFLDSDAGVNFLKMSGRPFKEDPIEYLKIEERYPRQIFEFLTGNKSIGVHKDNEFWLSIAKKA